ncbi:hypothetical protein X798_07820 [Onchocerca flexuosa]|uniref:Uncharacterized protein n=1 Tax=Onchocerca flexuosa TaxID=387005 RepID=A0A238BIK7_9BILA|nr:hypothetical protein X798_07820 [Onchocerca flexuosa]
MISVLLLELLTTINSQLYHHISFLHYTAIANVVSLFSNDTADEGMQMKSKIQTMKSALSQS